MIWPIDTLHTHHLSFFINLQWTGSNFSSYTGSAGPDSSHRGASVADAIGALATSTRFRLPAFCSDHLGRWFEQTQRPDQTHKDQKHRQCQDWDRDSKLQWLRLPLLPGGRPPKASPPARPPADMTFIPGCSEKPGGLPCHTASEQQRRDTVLSSLSRTPQRFSGWDHQGRSQGVDAGVQTPGHRRQAGAKGLAVQGSASASASHWVGTEPPLPRAVRPFRQQRRGLPAAAAEPTPSRTRLPRSQSLADGQRRADGTGRASEGPLLCESRERAGTGVSTNPSSSGK